jgi:enoyl-CoA hydratase/carnithine racemase
MAQTVLVNTKDHVEGVQAFVQKRDPKFVGG